MPPVIFAAVIGAGLYAGYKLFTKLIEQVQTPPRSEAERRRREATAAAGEPKNLGGLEWDEKAGAYRPKDGV